jgi:hypothetical protein
MTLEQAAKVLKVSLEEVQDLFNAIGGADPKAVGPLDLLEMRALLDEAETEIVNAPANGLLSTAQVVQKAAVDGPCEVTEDKAREWAKDNGVVCVDGMFVWTTKAFDNFLDYLIDNTPHVCDVCQEETLEHPAESGWIDVHVEKDDDSLSVYFCDECAKSDEKLRAGFETFLVEYRKLI